MGYDHNTSVWMAAYRYAKKKRKKWPIRLLSRAEMFYMEYKSGSTWETVAEEFSTTPFNAENGARNWARWHNKPWPPRKKEVWDKVRRQV